MIPVAALIWRGVTQVLSIPLSTDMDTAISGIAGLGHIMLGVGIVLFFLILKKQIKQSERNIIKGVDFHALPLL